MQLDLSLTMEQELILAASGHQVKTLKREELEDLLCQSIKLQLLYLNCCKSLMKSR